MSEEGLCWAVLGRSVVSDSASWTVAHQTPLSMEFSRQNTAVGCHALLQGIFPTKGLNPVLWHCRQILHCLSHEGSTWGKGRQPVLSSLWVKIRADSDPAQLSWGVKISNSIKCKDLVGRMVLLDGNTAIIKLRKRQSEFLWEIE